MIARCFDCGVRGRAGHDGTLRAVDGTRALLCLDCIADSIHVSWRHELAQRIHFAAHGCDERGCLLCTDVMSMLWGDPK